MPVINDTYDGTSGRTHAERNETVPARKARGKLISVIASVLLLSHETIFSLTLEYSF
jgi:hypothetical protein